LLKLANDAQVGLGIPSVKKVKSLVRPHDGILSETKKKEVKNQSEGSDSPPRIQVHPIRHLS
jgi:hypothetical protein